MIAHQRLPGSRRPCCKHKFTHKLQGPQLEITGVFCFPQGTMKEIDSKVKQESDWLDEVTLTPEQVQQLIQNKVRRAELMSQSHKPREQRSYDDA